MAQHTDHQDAHQEPQRPTLRAYPDPQAGCWMIDHSHAAQAEKLRRLFGTDHVPSAFTLDANPFDVGMALARLNPGHRIIVEQASYPYQHTDTTPGSLVPRCPTCRRPYSKQIDADGCCQVCTDRDDSAIGLQLANAIRATV